MESSDPKLVSETVDNKKSGYATYRARQIRFWTFVSIAVIVAIVAGVGGFKYSEQESALTQIDQFVSQEVAQRDGVKAQLESPINKTYLSSIPTESEDWSNHLELRDKVRIEAVENTKSRINVWPVFTNLDKRLDEIGIKSFGTRQDVEDDMRLFAVLNLSNACVAMRDAPNLKVEGALKKYDEANEAFYAESPPTDNQKESIGSFRQILKDSLDKGCPKVDVEPIGKPQADKLHVAPEVVSPSK